MQIFIFCICRQRLFVLREKSLSKSSLTFLPADEIVSDIQRILALFFMCTVHAKKKQILASIFDVNYNGFFLGEACSKNNLAPCIEKLDILKYLQFKKK